jgi:hypothetical protein
LRTLVSAFMVAMTVGLLGCGGNSGVPLDETVPVQGKVQLDGQPLPDGEIIFSVDGKPPQIIPIKGGAYNGKAMVGDNRVELAVYKMEIDSMTNDEQKVNTLPARFNTQTTLKAPVTEGGPNNFDFEAQSK